MVNKEAQEGSDEAKMENIFNLKPLGNLAIETSSTIANFKTQIYEQLVKNNNDLASIITSEDDITIRNPKSSDAGEIMSLTDETDQEQVLEDTYPYEGKEYYIQKINKDYSYSQLENRKPEDQVYNIFVREYKPVAW